MSDMDCSLGDAEKRRGIAWPLRTTCSALVIEEMEAGTKRVFVCHLWRWHSGRHEGES